MSRSRWVFAAVLAAGACAEAVTAPGECPDFCPGGQITVIDTVLATIIGRDSAYRGYVRPHEAASLLLADLPGFVESRAIWRSIIQADRITLSSSDTLTGAIIVMDSARLKVTITRRDTAAHNLTLRLYRLPLAIDSGTTYAGVAGAFTDSLLRTVNVDSLIQQGKDPVTGDSARVDSALKRVEVMFHLDNVQARYRAVDTGVVAFGLRVSADTLAGIAIGAVDANANFDPQITWFAVVDSAGLPVKRTLGPRGAKFDSFVFTPAAPALDSTLAVGGAPSARSLLRITLPKRIRDSAQIVRATLVLVPASAAQGVPADSFFVAAHGIDADFGGKSPIAADSARRGSARVRIGQTDTVRIDLTRLLRAWTFDSTAVTAVVLRIVPEGSTFAEIRFQPSANAAFRPALHVTYVPRFPFGSP